jgi:hypothetical protein
MSRTINIRLVKHISILMTLLLVFGCGSAAITPVQTITKDSSGKTLSTNTEYKVTQYQLDIPETFTFKDLQSAQSHVASFYRMEQVNKQALNNITNSGNANNPYAWQEYFLFFNQGLQLLQPGPTETKVVTVNSPTNTQSDKQTSVQQDITSTGNSATQTPLPQSVCNMMINGQCNPNTVTAVTAVVATAVIGGITAGVVTAVNNQAQQQQQEQQKKQDLWSILATTAKGAASGPSCQCQSATIQNPPYCTGNPCSCQGGQVVC